MITGSPLLSELIDALRCLSGVGEKSARRMAYQLLERNREGGVRLANALQSSMKNIGHCRQCRNFSEEALCTLCTSHSRNQHQLCIVESPADLIAIEQATDYRGQYFVLHGQLSPLDGLGPDELGLDKLADRLAEDVIEEMIIATNSTVEGQATAHYLGQLAGAASIRTTHLAYGVPLGGELEYVDHSTLAHAFGRRQSD